MAVKLKKVRHLTAYPFHVTVRSHGYVDKLCLTKRELRSLRDQADKQLKEDQ